MNVMVVEDNARVREFIKQILSEELDNLEQVYELEDGTDVVQTYTDVRPDWVLMDIEMKEMDGLAASRALLEKFPDAKIIIVTQYDEPGYRRTAEEVGVSTYLLKEHLVDLPEMLHNSET